MPPMILLFGPTTS